MGTRLSRIVAAAASVLMIGPAVATFVARPAAAATCVNGDGSSFAGIEFQQWQTDVGQSPYSLCVNYTGNSSGQGREDFGNHVVDFAVSDIRYDPPYDTNVPPDSSFEYVPVTAGGVSFMYNLKSQGFGTGGKPLQLSPRTICGIFTNAIQYWDDPSIASDNPGVTLPHVQVRPVVRQDPSGTNFVLEEYCIAFEPALYSSFVTAATKDTGTDYPDTPTSNWPVIPPAVGASTSDGVASVVAGTNSDGYITEVETGYAEKYGFPVAAVQNDTGAYVLPTASAVGTALSYATQQADGTHQLNFSPGNAAAYNPSTYSYLLLPLTGSTSAKGAVMTQFAEYDLTVGQTEAARLGYASIGTSLIEFGLQRIQAVPGYVAPTQQELAAVPGQTQSQTTTTMPSTTATTTAGASATTATTSATGSTTATTVAGSGSTSLTVAPGGTNVGSGGTTPLGGITPSGTSGSPGSVTGLSNSTNSSGATSTPPDPSAALASTTGPMASTGVESDLVFGAGLALLVVGESVRRLLRRRRPT